MAKRAKRTNDIYKVEKPKSRWPYIFLGVAIAIVLFIFLVIGLVVLIGAAFGSISSSTPDFQSSGNIAVIPVEGPIVSGNGDSLFVETPSAQTLVKWIEQAAEDDSFDAIILEINSPGGSPVASDEVASAIKKAEKTTVAVIREVGASGGYWVASATDYIFANRMSVTGSIGVLGSGLEFGEFLDDRNITYRRTVSGEYKDVGSPFRVSTEEERALLQGTVDIIHDIFIEEVAENRNLPPSRVRELATGYIFLGVEALDFKLIDELGSMEDAIEFIEEKHDIKAKPVRFGRAATFFDLLGQVLSNAAFEVGKGLGSELRIQEDPHFTV